MFRFRVCTRLNVVQTVVCLARGLPSAQGECIHSIRARHHEFLVCRQKRRYSSLNLCLQTVYARVDGALAIKAPSTRTYTVCRVQTQARNIVGGRHTAFVRRLKIRGAALESSEYTLPGLKADPWPDTPLSGQHYTVSADFS